MPMYEYECSACGHRFERIQKFSDPPIEECPACGERKVQKLLSSPAIQFKGTGWYITDYAKKGSVGTDSTKESKDKESSKESKESKESAKESTKSTESKDTKSSTPASGSTSTPKASGE
jgi:putative FmdB family regulatory protein